MIDEWSRESETGDRAELEELPEDAPFWPDISASAENCIGAECPHTTTVSSRRCGSARPHRMS